jgi:hypothetical protein
MTMDVVAGVGVMMLRVRGLLVQARCRKEIAALTLAMTVYSKIRRFISDDGLFKDAMLRYQCRFIRKCNASLVMAVYSEIRCFICDDGLIKDAMLRY